MAVLSRNRPIATDRSKHAREQSGSHSLRQLFGMHRNVAVMLAVILLVGCGEELWIRFLPEYLRSLGGSVWIVAVYGTLYNLLDAIYQYPGGWIADHVGRRRALIAFIVIAAVGYAVYLLPGWQWVLIGTLLTMSWDTLTMPGLFAIVGDNLPRNRRASAFALQSIARRIPTMLAPPIGGLLIAWLGLQSGIHLGLVLTIAVALIAAGLVACCYRENGDRHVEKIRFDGVWRRLDTNLRWLLASDILARWAEAIPRVFIVIYCLDTLQLSPIQFGWLITVQRLTSVLSYIPAAPLADRMNRKALIVDMVDESIRARAVGLYYFIRNMAIFPAAIVGGWLWQALGPAPMLYAAAAFGLAALLVYCIFGPGSADGNLQRGVA